MDAAVKLHTSRDTQVARDANVNLRETVEKRPHELPVQLMWRNAWESNGGRQQHMDEGMGGVQAAQRSVASGRLAVTYSLMRTRSTPNEDVMSQASVSDNEPTDVGEGRTGDGKVDVQLSTEIHAFMSAFVDVLKSSVHCWDDMYVCEAGDQYGDRR